MSLLNTCRIENAVTWLGSSFHAVKAVSLLIVVASGVAIGWAGWTKSLQGPPNAGAPRVPDNYY